MALIQQIFKLSSNFTELAIHRLFYTYMGLASGIIELRSGGSEEAILDYHCDPTRRVNSTRFN